MTPGEHRDHIWTMLMKEKAVSYPLPCFGHHPNFKGASKAAGLLLEALLAERLIHAGQTVLCYPDYVLKGLRKKLLETAVNVVVPAQHGDSYRFLEASKVNPSRVSSIAGAEEAGVKLSELPELSFAFIACVVLSQKGHALDKGYGFRLPNLTLPSATLVHPLQMVDEISEPSFKVSHYATPEKVFKV
jgi:5-formyltetrahydrofolate cyclo-ligase